MSGALTVVELRVHGVSGTPPEAMLSCPAELLVQVGGDEDAGFYRRAEWIDDTASPPVNGLRRLLEAYSWGGLTSRRASRALWLLFLPFSLINLAHWMLPPVTHRRPAAVVVTTLRLLALSFTLTFLLALAVVVLDLAVWQCAGLDDCGSGWSALAYLSGMPVGLRLAVGALPLVAVILGLWFLGREKTRPLLPGQRPPPGAVVSHGQPTPLADRTFWNQDPSVDAMRACHVIVWTTGVAVLVLAAQMSYATAELTRTGTVALLVVNVLMMVTAVSATASTKATGRGGSSARNFQTRLAKLRGFALGLLAVSLVWVAVRGDVGYPPAPTVLPGVHAAISGLIALQIALLAVVFVGTALAVRGTPRGAARRAVRIEGYRVRLGGFTGPFVAVLGWLLGGGFSAGIGLWAAHVLGTPVYTTGEARQAVGAHRAAAGEAAPLILPPPYVWASVATMLVVIAALPVVAFVWWRFVRPGARGFAGEPPSPDSVEACASPSLWRRIDRSRRLARLPDVLPPVAVSLIVAAVVFTGLAAGLPPLVPAVNDAAFVLMRSAFVAAPVVGLAVALVAVVIAAYRSRPVRRVVAILWDVMTFWPQVTHPLTPPSYGGRAVWDLRTRMAELVGDPDTPAQVILVAHSQGTIVAAATLLQAADPQEHYPLLTFGTPLRRLYASNFPAYFGPGITAALEWFPCVPERRWINLWARTDPLGGWVLDDGMLLEAQTPSGRVRAAVDVRILDVPQADPEHGAYEMAADGPVCGHSGYWLRDEYATAMQLLQDLVAPPGVRTEATAAPTPAAM